MSSVVVVLAIALVGVIALAAGWLLANQAVARRPVPPPVVLPAAEVPHQLIAQTVALAVADANDRASRERDLAVQAAVEHAVTVTREQLGAHTQAADVALTSRHQLIDQRLGEVQTGVQTDIARLSTLVSQLNEATAQRFGQVDASFGVFLKSLITQKKTS